MMNEHDDASGTIAHRYTNTPLVDEDGEPLCLYWVECVGCGGDVPAKASPDKGIEPEVPMNRIEVDDEELGTVSLYASPGCTEQAAVNAARQFGTNRVRIFPPIGGETRMTSTATQTTPETNRND